MMDVDMDTTPPDDTHHATELVGALIKLQPVVAMAGLDGGMMIGPEPGSPSVPHKDAECKTEGKASTPERPTRKTEQYTPERQPRACGRMLSLNPGGPRRRLHQVVNFTSATTPPESDVEKPIHEIVAQLDSDLWAVMVEGAESLQARALHAPEHVRHEISVSGALEKLAGKLQQGSRVCERAISTLQNLSAEVKPDDCIKDAMVQFGMLTMVLQMIQNRIWVAKAIATLMNLIIGSDERKQAIVNMGGVECLAPMLVAGDPEVRFLAINTLTSLAIGSNERKHAIARFPGLLAVAVKMVSPTEADVTQLNALELLQSLVLGSSDRKRAVLEAGFIPKLTELLASPRCSNAVRNVGLQLLKGFAEFLGWESKSKGEAEHNFFDEVPLCLAWPLRQLVEMISGCATFRTLVQPNKVQPNTL